VLLILIVFMFTFITMVGGNPKHDAYGFRYWNNPGSFAEYISKGSLGRFEGFLGAVWSASFTIVGPEYMSMVAGETKLPRRYLKTAFKTTYLRFAFFFIGSALCVGIVIPYNDTTNALLVTSIFSAGNAYTYYGTRSLYGLALQGQAPKVFRRCTKAGVPIYCLCVVIVFPFLAFLNVSSGSAQVLTWLTNIITAAQVIDYIIICVTYLFFYRALRAQSMDRRTLPYYGYFQPYSAWIGLIWMTCVVCCYGYSTFLPGNFTVGDFFTYYTMVLAAPVLFFGWKLFKRTKFIKAHEADLVWDRPVIDAYEATFTEYAPGFWTEILQMFGLRRKKQIAQEI
jgi:amino acid transporter